VTNVKKSRGSLPGLRLSAAEGITYKQNTKRLSQERGRNDLEDPTTMKGSAVSANTKRKRRRAGSTL